MAWFGSKATSGLCQPLIAMMPPHDVYVETHLGGGAIMRRKPPALRNIGIDLDARAIEGFSCDYPVERVHGCAHRFLAGFPFEGGELVYSDPPYLHRVRRGRQRYRYDYGEADSSRTGCTGRASRAGTSRIVRVSSARRPTGAGATRRCLGPSASRCWGAIMAAEAGDP